MIYFFFFWLACFRRPALDLGLEFLCLDVYDHSDAGFAWAGNSVGLMLPFA